MLAEFDLILMAPELGLAGVEPHEAGGPVALVLRSKLQELAKTTSAQRAAKRWQDPKLGRNRSKQKRSK